jgi:hypothetical protein
MLDMATLTTIVRLAEDFGPFLFAILFILVVTRTAHTWYREALVRTTPHANPGEIRTLRFYFLLSIYCGVFAMVLSIGWWIYNQSRGQYIYQAAIIDLGEDEETGSDYFNKMIIRPLVQGAKPIHDTYFLFVQTTPFVIGDKFTIEYYKIPHMTGSATGLVASPQYIDIIYQGHGQDIFRVTAGSGQSPKLEVAETTANEAFNFLAARNIEWPAHQAAMIDRTRAVNGVAR